MKILKSLGAALLAAGLFGGPASAMPAGDLPQLDDSLVVQVRACHGDVQRHFVPEYGRTMYHRHRRPDCHPIPVQPPQARDCHREVRRHYLPRYGNVPHRHIGTNCRVKVYNRYDPYRPRPGACIQIGPIRYCEY
ncbi:hypothetical protein [Aminobacter sp. HY435]|uniref:hypothetical protein n=1 Tax=Aminobacter sp. HY435 TaxID=2970917 RepID=UPI0022B9C4B9|nr:hypothetical protein [Aminobacter sp. HY435]